MCSSIKHKIKKFFQRKYSEKVRPSISAVDTKTPCMRCGSTIAYLINTPVSPDFDLEIINEDLRSAFSDHRDGVCQNCGLYQAYDRFGNEHSDMINGIGKDALTTDEIYHSYPVPEDFIDHWYGDSVERQRVRWSNAFRTLGLSPKRILILRTWFGRQIPMLAEEFGADISCLDISPICNRYVAEKYPSAVQLEGTINGYIKGSFIDGPPFDLVIVQHILIHSCDVTKALKTLRHLIRDGGGVLLSAETKRAPSNPFHLYYPTEFHTASMLGDVFDETYKMDEDGIIPGELTSYTGRAIEFIGIVRNTSTTEN